jgi:signal transduction histidine kinase
VRRLLDFSHRSNTEKQPESIRNAIESVVSFLNPQVLAKKVSLNTDLGTINGSLVLADRSQLEALFLILLSNSLDAISPGGHITIRGRNTVSQQIEIEIADDGCGIDNATLAHIFEPFFTTKPIGKGTGLGLAIASNIVREHGGSIHLVSQPRKGTSALVKLPWHVGSKRAAG